MRARIPWHPDKRQKQIMNDEIKKNVLAEFDTFADRMDAAALYTLHKTFGFGKKRLRRFYDAFAEERKKLAEYYEVGSEVDYLCKVQLKKIGVDVEAWNNENNKRTEDVTR